jgi:NTE family protein
MLRRLRILFACGLLSPSLACSALRFANQPLERWDPGYGYRPSNVAAERDPGDAMLLLAFSGGGTRAAALAYGALQELRDTPLAGGRRMLDEVDVITSVSGGSFTAAYYGLYGDRIFEDFEARFLRKNVEAKLILGLLNPLNWLRMSRTLFDRSEVAIRWYDENIFDRKTFADLLAAKGPMLEINATDIGARYHFTFFQPQFDLLCSDLSSLQVARAVAASSAVPVLFSPIVIKNYAGQCGFERPPWLEEALKARATSPRRFRKANIIDEWLDESNHPYVHLLDGGIADNIGLRGPIENVLLVGGAAERLRIAHAAPPRRIVAIVINAEVSPPPEFTLAAAAPSLANILGTVSGMEINSINFDTLELMRETLKHWGEDLAPPGGEPIPTTMITVGFELIEDPEEREYFNSVPTAFSLSDETVDKLIGLSRSQIRASAEYQEVVRALGGVVAEPAPAAPAPAPAQ